jgi:hypothetical protein
LDTPTPWRTSVAYSIRKPHRVSSTPYRNMVEIFLPGKNEARLHRHNLIIYCSWENNTIKNCYFQLREAAKQLYGGYREAMRVVDLI